jgi:hypothetical protein
LIVDSAQPASAPKGRFISAQGNALGLKRCDLQALKGRFKTAHFDSPFQGLKGNALFTQGVALG